MDAHPLAAFTPATAEAYNAAHSRWAADTPFQGIGHTPCHHRSNGFVLAANGTSAVPHQGKVVPALTVRTLSPDPMVATSALVNKAVANGQSFEMPIQIVDLPARQTWNARFLKQNAPQIIVADDRPGAPEGNFWWSGDRDQVGQFWHGYRSAWLPASLLEKEQQRALADALFAGSRHWTISLHCNKRLAGAPVDVLSAAKDTAMNPVVLEAFALAIIGGGSPPAFADIPGHAPDVTAARQRASAINRAMKALLQLVPHPGSYVAECDFFEPEWQQAFWGAHYPRLAAVKRQYDPSGLFFVHHGVGSEAWSADGFTRLAGR